jgi:hypothetical protein
MTVIIKNGMDDQKGFDFQFDHTLSAVTLIVVHIAQR